MSVGVVFFGPRSERKVLAGRARGARPGLSSCNGAPKMGAMMWPAPISEEVLRCAPACGVVGVLGLLRCPLPFVRVLVAALVVAAPVVLGDRFFEESLPGCCLEVRPVEIAFLAALEGDLQQLEAPPAGSFVAPL